jgi:hypothetical protein
MVIELTVFWEHTLGDKHIKYFMKQGPPKMRCKHKFRDTGSTRRFRSQECKTLIQQLLWNPRKAPALVLPTGVLSLADHRPIQFLFEQVPAVSHVFKEGQVGL